MLRQAYDLKPRIESSPKVAEGVERALRAVKKDRAVKSVGISARRDTAPAVIVTRGHFDEALRRLDERTKLFSLSTTIAAQEAPTLVHETRTQVVRANLTVIKAVLLRSKRKWQFSWQGNKVSAPITDPNFFDQLESRSVALRQGDALDADLAITQRYLPEADVWMNHAYEVTKVYSVKLGETQATMDFTAPPGSAPSAPPRDPSR
jgi:hypothetical protein